METPPSNPPGDAEPPRPPDRNDLFSLCRELNRRGARYVVVGGMAMIQHGHLRATEDIDLLLESSRSNVKRVRQALEILPDRAVRDMADGDLEQFTVVRVADEIVVDLMLETAGFSFADAEGEIEHHEIEGVPIPFASAHLLLQMKRTEREKDALDRMFLERKIAREGEEP
jgi:hypothetical protein